MWFFLFMLRYLQVALHLIVLSVRVSLHGHKRPFKPLDVDRLQMDRGKHDLVHFAHWKSRSIGSHSEAPSILCAAGMLVEMATISWQLE